MKDTQSKDLQFGMDYGPALFRYDPRMVRNKVLYVPEGVVDIAPNTFCGIPGFHTVVLAETVRAIGDNAFRDCPDLEHIEFYSADEAPALEVIGDYAFANCPLIKVCVPNTVKHIGKYSFSNCVKMKEFWFPERIPYIPEGILEDSYDLRSVKMPIDITDIRERAFFHSRIEYLDVFCSSELVIGKYAFAKSRIRKFRVFGGGKIRVIEDGAFSYSDLCEFPDGFSGQEIPKCGFDHTKLTHVELPSQVQSIGDYAFDGNPRLEDVRFNMSLMNIGKYSFSNCPKLEFLYLPRNLRNVGDDAFSNCPNIKKIIWFPLDRKDVNFSNEAFYHVYDSQNKIPIIAIIFGHEKNPFLYTRGAFQAICVPDLDIAKRDYGWDERISEMLGYNIPEPSESDSDE